MGKKDQEVEQVQGTETTVETSSELATVNNTSLSISEESIFEDFSGFEEMTEELLSEELLNSMKDLEIRAVLKRKVNREIKGEEKVFIESTLLFNGGDRKNLLLGQYKFIRAFENFDKGNGVAVVFIFKGKIKIDGAKTLNDFQIFAKSL